MIVKLQVSLTTSLQKQQFLAYDERHTFMIQDDVNDDLLELMNGRKKAFFHAEIVDTILEFGEEAPPQDW